MFCLAFLQLALAYHEEHLNISAAHAAIQRAERATKWHQYFQNFRPSCLFGGGALERTNGELTTLGMAQVLREMPAVCAFSAKHAVFLDLGSGNGQVPLFINVASGIRAVGVEIDGCRHDIAQRRADAVDDMLRGGRVTYMHADVRAIGLLNATTVHMHSTLFSSALKRDVMQLVQRAGARLRCILDSGNFDVQAEIGEWGVPVHVVEAPLSWTPRVGMPLYFYVRKELAAAHHLRPVAKNMREALKIQVEHELALQNKEWWSVR